jgi:hypothetical protein
MSSWSWSYGSWIYDYLCNQYLSPLTFWIRIPLRKCWYTPELISFCKITYVLCLWICISSAHEQEKRFLTLIVWSWSYGSWIYDYLCNQYLSPLTFWIRIPLRKCILLDTTLWNKVYQWLPTTTTSVTIKLRKD